MLFKTKYKIHKLTLTEEALIQWKKMKYRYFLIKCLYFLFFIFVLFYFYIHLSLYIQNLKYEDNNVYIKEMWLWYNVYSKYDYFENVKFYNTNDKDSVDLIWFIDDNILYNVITDKWENKIIILNKNTTLRQKTEELIIDNIELTDFIKIDNNNYLILYNKKKWDNIEYCFIKNTLNFNKKWQFCISQWEDFPIEKFKWLIYKNSVILVLNKNILVIDDNNKININIVWNDIVNNIWLNKNHDIKIYTDKEFILNGLILDYYLLKSKKDGKTYKINLNKFLN